MSALEIGLIVFLKGALVSVLIWKGWWPDWEKRAYRREEMRRVFKAYEEWCDKVGKRPFADPKIPERLKFTDQRPAA